MNPIDFINALRKTDEHIELIYTNGGCYQFSKLLKAMYPESESRIDMLKGHVVTMIEGEHYDITGVVKGIYLPLTKEDEEMCEKWSFSNNYAPYRECPVCEEPVFFNQ